MLKSGPIGKDNLKVLGMLVRYKRIMLGYSLRGLGEIAKISHTMISNFERGIMIPNQETITDIFKVLDLEFYTDHKVLDDFNDKYTAIYNHILYYEYEKAEMIISEIEENHSIFENSKEVVNYNLIRWLFYVISNRTTPLIESEIKKYEDLVEFFSERQKQLCFFIRGLNAINKELYHHSRMNLEKALKIGNPDLNLLIKEYYVFVLGKADKFIDARIIAEECILEFEQKTNYIRAMRLRTGIAHAFIQKIMYKEAKQVFYNVYDFSVKYGVKDLENSCNVWLAQIALNEKKYDLYKEYLDKVEPEYSMAYHFLRFNQIFMSGTNKEFIEYYNNIMKLEKIKKHKKTYNFFKMIFMLYKDENMVKKEYERLINNQTSIALKSDDAEMLELITRFAVSYYKKERQYKKALKASETNLKYLKFGYDYFN